MHGLSNDFIVIDNLDKKLNLTPTTIQLMSHRKQGVGFDQLLVLEPASHQDADYDYRIFNSDGNEVEHCANGARCIALYIKRKQLHSKDTVRLKIKDRILNAEIDGNLIRVNMGTPQINPQDILYTGRSNSLEQTIEFQGDKIAFYLISMGNPHAIILRPPKEKLDLNTLGSFMNQVEHFPRGVNVSIADICTPNKVEIGVFERGAGITYACGTAACATMAIGKHLKLLEPTVTVHQKGGPLTITWENIDKDLMMSGSATYVFDGDWGL